MEIKNLDRAFSPMARAFLIGMMLGAAYGVFFAVFQGEPH